MVATRFGNQLRVAARGDGSVKRIDLEFPYAIKSIDVFVEPESVMLTPSEHTLIVSSRSVISHDGRYVYATYDTTAAGVGGVAVVDVRTQAVVQTWEYPSTGRPHGVWYSRKIR